MFQCHSHQQDCHPRCSMITDSEASSTLFSDGSLTISGSGFTTGVLPRFRCLPDRHNLRQPRRPPTATTSSKTAATRLKTEASGGSSTQNRPRLRDHSISSPGVSTHPLAQRASHDRTEIGFEQLLHLSQGEGIGSRGEVINSAPHQHHRHDLSHFGDHLSDVFRVDGMVSTTSAISARDGRFQ